VIRNIPRLYLIRALFWMHFFSAVIVPFYTTWGGITLAQVRRDTLRSDERSLNSTALLF